MGQGSVNKPECCPVCQGRIDLRIKERVDYEQYVWMCVGSGNKHFVKDVSRDCDLKKLKINSWMPLLHYMNMLRLGFKNTKARKEIRAGYGNIDKKTFRVWKRLYQGWLKGGLESSGALLIGGRQSTIVCDEI